MKNKERLYRKYFKDFNKIINHDKAKINTVLGMFIRKTAFIMVLVLVVSSMLSVTGCSLGASKKKKGAIPGSSITPAPTGNVKDLVTDDKDKPTLTGILSDIDTKLLRMNFVDILTGTEYEVPYSGGTDIQDAYGKIKAAVTMSIGEIYDIYCNEHGKAVKIYGYKDAWTRNNVSGITLDEDSRTIGIGATTLTYEAFAVVTSDKDRISIAKLIDQDVLTIRGIDNKIYSINVNSGHGYISLTGTTAFEGGYVTVGDNLLYGVTKDMLITAPVGTHKLVLQNGQLIETREITVNKNTTTTEDFSNIQTQSIQKGTIKFSITPAEAILAIDGVETDYSEPVTLTYGKHSLKLVCNHYTEYTETFYVNKVYQTKVIDMVSTGNQSSTTTKASDKASGYKVSVTAPAGAALYVDSVYIGVVPCSFNKTYGNRTITLSQSGYNTVSYTISIPNATGDLTYAFPDMEKQNSGNSSTKSTVPLATTPSVTTPSVTTPKATVPTVTTKAANG